MSPKRSYAFCKIENMPKKPFEVLFNDFWKTCLKTFLLKESVIEQLILYTNLITKTRLTLIWPYLFNWLVVGPQTNPFEWTKRFLSYHTQRTKQEKDFIWTCLWIRSFGMEWRFFFKLSWTAEVAGGSQTGNKSKGNANRRKLTDFVCKQFILLNESLSNTQRIAWHLVSYR